MNNSIDPLTVLHGDELPVQPDPEFAARLRSRLETAVNLYESQPDRTRGVVMSGTETAIAELNEPAVAAPSPRPAALPYLTVANARDAIDWYVEAFGASVVGEPIVMDDGRIGHAELALAGGVLYLADEYPELGLKAPVPQSTSVSLMLHVPDTDTALETAREKGARVEREVYESYGTRNATIVDPFGHRWMLSGPSTGAVTPIQHGDVGYVSVWTPDADRAAAFYGHVLGWTYDRATHQVTNTKQHIGIYPVPDRQTLLCCYAVADLAAARQAIEAGGGQAGEAQEFDFGTVLDATDSLGTAFAVFQPAPGQPRPELNGAGPGELSYITYEVPDSAAFKAFYSRVLYWTFDPGRVEDGWQIAETHPMAGVAGGSERAVTVPMWTVADIDAAVARVREAGGTVIQAPSRQPYGLMAECTDDQGARFYLGQF
ncbi:VOC family protein [Mycobacterium hubeiense]|uniref:VOC family protein n=1 Tax=Mycobacterium hubeiense TaxID=1867256 RepID=UPI000C7F74C9|nr:VOC family protein [Mycobacterium sp. QGD 101]